MDRPAREPRSSRNAENGAQEDAEPARLLRRTCAFCGSWIDYSGAGRYPTYCSKSCRNRAWEVRSAERRLGRTLTAGAGTVATTGEPVREVVTRVVREHPRGVRTPTAAAEWTRHLEELARQLRAEQLGREHWNHGRLFAAVTEVLAALDEAHPGGLDNLRRRRR